MKLERWVVLLLLVAHSHALAYSVHGSISNRYRFRTTGGVSDHDLEAMGTLDFGDQMQDRVSGSVQVGGIFQLNGTDTGSPFTSVYDSFSSPAVERIYQAYADFQDLGPLEKIRAGRQSRYEFGWLYYDGATLESRTVDGVKFTLYGGVPVHLYETSIGNDPGDWMVGGAFQVDPASWARIRLEAVHLKDDTSGYRAAVGKNEDTLIGWSLWLDSGQTVSFSSRFTAFQDQVRDVDAEMRLWVPERELTTRIRFYSLLKAIGVREVDVDSYGFVGAYEPFVEGSVILTKGFGQRFFVDTGFVGRTLLAQNVSSAFNHGYNRAFLTLSTVDLPIQGMSLAATGDYFHGTDNVLKNDVFAGSFSADQEFWERRIRASIGTGYYLYRYNLYTGEDEEDVRTYFARVTGKIWKSLEGRLTYEMEQNSTNDFHTVDTRVTWKF